MGQILEESDKFCDRGYDKSKLSLLNMNGTNLNFDDETFEFDNISVCDYIVITIIKEGGKYDYFDKNWKLAGCKDSKSDY